MHDVIVLNQHGNVTVTLNFLLSWFLVTMAAPAAKRSRVHFGSLEEQEKKRLQQEKINGEDKSGISAAVLAGMKAGNINVATKGAQYFE